MKNNLENCRLETKTIHSGEKEFQLLGSINPPVFYSTSYRYESIEDELRYLRLHNTPNHIVINEKLAALENAEAAFVTASGMAAISAAVLALIEPGGHILAQRGIYGTAQYFFNQDLPRLGYQVTYADFSDAKSLESLLTPQTRALYFESLTNPLLAVADFKGLVKLSKDRGILTFIDNTFASPVNFNPLDLGIDVAIHSATKYLNGHSDILAGVVCGSQKLMNKVGVHLSHLGGTLDAHSCFLLSRGLKTLCLRLERHNKNALELAHWLGQRPEVEEVYYPGLESHAGHQRAKEYFRGMGGMISFTLSGDEVRADRFLRNLTIPLCAVSLGGVESLVTRPALTSHKSFTDAEREAMGIPSKLIRFSVGIENIEDLKADLANALNS